MLNGKTVLITGGTGSFGQRFTEIVLKRYTPKRLIVFSRDELMVGEDDARNTLEFDDYYAVLPSVAYWNQDQNPGNDGGWLCPEGFRYSSETNTQWLTVAELEQIIDQSKLAAN